MSPVWGRAPPPASRPIRAEARCVGSRSSLTPPAVGGGSAASSPALRPVARAPMSASSSPTSATAAAARSTRTSTAGAGRRKTVYGRLPGRKRFLRRTGVDGQLLPCIRPSVRPQGLLASMRFAGRLPTIKSSSRLCGSPGFCRPTVRPSCHRVEDRPRSSWKLATPPILGVMDCSLAFVLRTDQAVAR